MCEISSDIIDATDGHSQAELNIRCRGLQNNCNTLWGDAEECNAVRIVLREELKYTCACY